MTAAYAYHLDAGSPSVQSGRPHSILLNFRKLGLEVKELFPLVQGRLWERRFHKVWNLLRFRHYLMDRDPQLLRSFGQQLGALLRETDADFVFSPSTLPLSYLETDLPITFCADAPFCAMLNYYDSFSRLAPRQVDLSEQLEAAVLQRAQLAVYPSEWAAHQAGRHYGIPPERLAVIPFGANFGRENQRGDVEQWIERRVADRHLRLLFVGREWDRKGGDLVLETVDWLRARGVELQIDLVGCQRPSGCTAGEFAVFHGNLSPRDPEQAARLTDLYRRAHLVFVPSRAEAYGMTFCEANAFGIPAITTATGGIQGIVSPGINGCALPPEAGAADYGQAILEAFESPERYQNLCLSSFARFEERLNWAAFARDFVQHPNLAPNAIDRNSPSPGTPLASSTTSAEAGATASSRSRPLRLAFLENDYLASENVRSWSGLPYHMKQSLQNAGFDIVPLRVRETHLATRWIRFAYWKLLRRRRYLRHIEPGALRDYGRQLRHQLAVANVDAIFTPSSWFIAHLETSLPVVLWTDATFANVLNFYRAFSNLAPVSIRDAHTIERSAMGHCTLGFFSSDWAKESAIRDYGLPADRAHLLPFGANVERELPEAELGQVIAARPADRCRLLFVGVEWERKGAALTLEIIRRLQARGVDTTLHIVGCQAPPGTELPPGVTVVGFISKATPEGRQQIDDLFRQSHLFIMPTRADCTPCVYSEANCYALPCISTEVGGIASVITPDVNGRTFPLDAPAESYADYIADLLRDRPRYEQLCRTSWQESRLRLSWRRSAEKLKALTEQTCAAFARERKK